jgi:hypothetical protein
MKQAQRLCEDTSRRGGLGKDNRGRGGAGAHLRRCPPSRHPDKAVSRSGGGGSDGGRLPPPRSRAWTTERDASPGTKASDQRGVQRARPVVGNARQHRWKGRGRKEATREHGKVHVEDSGSWRRDRRAERGDRPRRTWVKAYWAGAAACPEARGKEPVDHRAELRALFRGWPSPIPELIEETPTERMNKIYVHDHDPIDTWHRDNVLLIGDAAHAALPTSGQGASQALEDAWHLADCLGSATSLEQAFTAFTRRRHAKSAAIATGARDLARSLFARAPAISRARCSRPIPRSARRGIAGARRPTTRPWFRAWRRAGPADCR